MATYRRTAHADLPIIPEAWAGAIATLLVAGLFTFGACALITAGIGTGACHIQAMGQGVRGAVRYQLLGGCWRWDPAVAAWVAMPATERPQ